MSSRFVRPEVATLTLANGDTLTVKKRLTAGEKREAFGRMYIAGADGDLTRHPVLYGIHLVCAYLIDWSLKGLDGQPVVIRDLSIDQLKSIVDNLSPEDFTEIKDLIEQHEEKMVTERADAKKIHDGETGYSVTSPSQHVMDGRSLTSAT